MGKIHEFCSDFGTFLEKKGERYGETYLKVNRVMAIMYPDGIPPHCLDGIGSFIRVVEKLLRLSNKANMTPEEATREEESPWKDIAGYSVLEAMKVENRKK
jgi:hypothetical protein